jgi:hypothetical protein
MAESLPADLTESNFHAALVAKNTAVLHAFVLSAEALPVGDGTKNLGAEQAVTLGFKSAVVNRLRLGDFTVGPGPNLFWAR